MLDTIELLIDEENDKPGVFAISLVEFPAIESNFVALSDHKIELKTIDEDKRLVMGVILKADKKIFRKRGDYEYNIIFNKDTVRKASQIYLREVRNHNTKVDHKAMAEGVYLTESWVVEDLEKDKTALYGLNASVGDWAGTMKVDNDEIWKSVKEGHFLGFSIEGLFDEKPVDQYKEKWEQIKKILS